MDRQCQVFVFLCFAFAVLTASIVTGFATVAVGVKKGDWMEYTVAFTGNATEGHDVVWARIEITNVQDAAVAIKIDSRDSSGKQDSSMVTLNLEEGKLGDQFIIPANLNVGDAFLDEYLGNVTISGSEERTIAGAQRTLVYATSTERSVYWDKATGVIVEGLASTAGFTMTTELDKTNMWQPQPDATIYPLLVIAFSLLVGTLVVFLFRRRKKATQHVQK